MPVAGQCYCPDDYFQGDLVSLKPLKDDVKCLNDKSMCYVINIPAKISDDICNVIQREDPTQSRLQELN